MKTEPQHFEQEWEDPGLRVAHCFWAGYCEHARLPIKVSIDEARTGEGHKCPVCGITWGSYICSGFPRPQGMTVWGEKKALLSREEA